jgi:hypothetical protein
MKVVALLKPAREDAAQLLCEVANLTQAEARMRVAPEPPALLALLDDAKADEVAAQLRKRGLAAISVAARSSGPKLIVRSFSFEEHELTLRPREGEALALRYDQLAMILRAQSAHRSDTTSTQTARQFSMARGLATGGLSMSKKVTTTTRSQEETVEQSLLIYSREGKSAALSEIGLDLTGLGKLQPSRAANMAELASRIRARAPQAFYDERLLRLGRRALPFVLHSESRVSTGKSTTVETDTAGGVDLLAEVLWQGLQAGLIP